MDQSFDVAMQTAQFLCAEQNQMTTAVHQTKQRAVSHGTYVSFDLEATNRRNCAADLSSIAAMSEGL